jgi:hypothetical protein
VKIFTAYGECRWCGWPRARRQGCLICQSPEGVRELAAFRTPPPLVFSDAAVSRILQQSIAGGPLLGPILAYRQAAYETCLLLRQRALHIIRFGGQL